MPLPASLLLLLLLPLLAVRAASLARPQDSAPELGGIDGDWRDPDGVVKQFSWVPHYLHRYAPQTEKRHQSLLPYHPVVRFRGLGGPGEAWEMGAGGDLASLAAAFSEVAGDLAALKPQEHTTPLTGGGEVAGGEPGIDHTNAGEFMTLLESMVGLREDDEGHRVIKSMPSSSPLIRFGNSH